MSEGVAGGANRRVALKGIVWGAPVLAVATSAPALATSQTKSRIRFTNVTANEGKLKDTIYVNTKVNVIDGPGPVKNLMVAVRVEGYEAKGWRVDQLGGWGTTGLLRHEFKVSGKESYLVTFTAEADGVAPIVDYVTVTAPKWWL